jgi:hypothetical protein
MRKFEIKNEALWETIKEMVGDCKETFKLHNTT